MEWTLTETTHDPLRRAGTLREPRSGSRVPPRYCTPYRTCSRLRPLFVFQTARVPRASLGLAIQASRPARDWGKGPSGSMVRLPYRARSARNRKPGGRRRDRVSLQHARCVGADVLHVVLARGERHFLRAGRALHDARPRGDREEPAVGAVKTHRLDEAGQLERAPWSVGEGEDEGEGKDEGKGEDGGEGEDEGEGQDEGEGEGEGEG